MFLEVLRLLIISYLLLLAAALVIGVGRPVLAYPARSFYLTVRLVLSVVSLGRLNIEPLARKTTQQGQRRLSEIKFALRDWREERYEEKTLARGEEPELQQMNWASSTSNEEPVLPPTLWGPPVPSDANPVTEPKPESTEPEPVSPEEPPSVFPLEPLE